MKNSVMIFTLFILNASAFSFSCHDVQPIIQKPIQFDKTRKALTREYQLAHYHIDSMDIEPKMIVLHWTMGPTMISTFNTFNPPILAYSEDAKVTASSKLNTSSHFLVDRDGTIYQLMPETWMARHVIGLNHYAIGIENVGGVDEKEDLTEKQVEANAFLICYLKKKYPAIHDVIGHKDYLSYKNTPLWLEQNPDYYTKKTDPGQLFLEQVNALLKRSK